ncbi:MAG TPA: MFS transporter [Candidatus Dormibacteraeota bacterium]|nr:MFS transporter [Candidatus Dormibacteraeota bacterium]
MGAPIRRLLVIWLAIELVDELVFGVQDSALPLIRGDLHLGYAAIGLLLSVPALAANLIEMPVGLLADSHRRRRLVIGGGLVFTVALFAFAAAPSYAALLLAMCALYPASGAFVALSQADLMDADVARRDQNMARWNLAGSIGELGGPGLLVATVFAGASWRGAYAVMGVIAAIAVAGLLLAPGPAPKTDAHEDGLRGAIRAALRSLRRVDVLRALLLLEVSDLMLDVLTGYLALYFVDVLGEPAWVGALAVGVRIGAGLAGDVLTVHLLERVAGTAYVRATAAAALVAFPVFLLAPGVVPKLAALAALSVLTAGWYPVLQARLYAALPGQSGAQLAIGNVFRMAVTPVPLLIGLMAARFGLGAALWIFAAGPVLLTLLLWRARDHATA